LRKFVGAMVPMILRNAQKLRNDALARRVRR